MTEDRWLASTHIDYMLDGCRALKVLNGRKSRLFACGCFRLLWPQIRCPQVKRAVEMAEGRVERQVSEQELQSQRYPSGGVAIDSLDHHLQITIQSLVISNMNPGYVAWSVRAAIDRVRYGPHRYDEGYPPQADLLRDVIGNPFRPISLDPTWFTSTVIALAKQMYESHDFSPMSILADALQDAGCGNENVLAHCRHGGIHMRGCHLVDLVLKKK
jgi:hypothetical protein